MSCSDASLPMASRSGHVGVVGLLGGGEDVVEDLAGVGEEGGAEATDVGHGARCREPRAGRDRDTGAESRRPPGEERARVEERQRRVHDVAVGELGDRGDVGPGAGVAALRAADRLRQAGRSRREDQQEQVVLADRPVGRRPDRRWTPGARRSRARRRRGPCRRPPGPVCRTAGSTTPVEVTRTSQSVCSTRWASCGAAVRRVDPDDHGPRECGRGEPEEVVGDVVEQDADVGRPSRGRGARRGARPVAGPRRRAAGSSRSSRRTAGPGGRRRPAPAAARPRSSVVTSTSI